MKIVHVINYPGQGGMEKYAYLLAKYAINSGHSVEFVFGGEGPLVNQVNNIGCHVHMLKMRAPYDLVAVYNLVKLLKNLKPDVVHTHFMRENFLVIDASRFVKIPAIFSTVHRLEPKSSLQASVNQLYSKGLTKFIAVSPLAKEYLLNEGIKESKIITIPNGAEIGEFDKNNIRKRYSLTKKDIIFAYVGRFSEEKGHEILIRAFAKSHKANWKLLLVGDGELIESMKGLAQKLKISNKIIFTGAIENGYEAIAVANYYVQPSKIENMPISVVEAMLLGVPVLASNCSAHNWLLKNGEFGILFKNGNINSLIAGFSEIIGDKSTMNKAKNAQEYALSHFTATKMWENTEKLYQKYVQAARVVLK